MLARVFPFLSVWHQLFSHNEYRQHVQGDGFLPITKYQTKAHFLTLILKNYSLLNTVGLCQN